MKDLKDINAIIEELEFFSKMFDTGVEIFENKESLLTRLSENADEPEATYEYMKNELRYLEDEECVIYSIDLYNGFPEYFIDPKSAYEYAMKG